MATDEELYWSNEIVPETDDIPDYLFRSVHGRVEFVIIESEMEQLNDYCVLCLRQTFNELTKLRKQVKDYETRQEQVVHPEFGDIISEIAWSMSELQIPVWEDTNAFLVRAMCLILISAFTERSLKSLCTSLAPKGMGEPKPKKRQSKISAYLDSLANICKVDFIESQDSIKLREKCREIRNDFAHGDWDEVRGKVSKIHLGGAFMAISNLMHSLESGAEVVWKTAAANNSFNPTPR